MFVCVCVCVKGRLIKYTFVSKSVIVQKEPDKIYI